eukprot:scaffold86904_cov63-Phaeocystis_antarctica.AAC.5
MAAACFCFRQRHTSSQGRPTVANAVTHLKFSRSPPSSHRPTACGPTRSAASTEHSKSIWMVALVLVVPADFLTRPVRTALPITRLCSSITCPVEASARGSTVTSGAGSTPARQSGSTCSRSA